MRHRTSLALVALAVVCSSGSATLVHGSSQEIEIDSQPTDARVFVGAKHVGTTPVSVHLSRHDAHPIVRVEKEGFVTEVVRLKRGITPR